MTIEESSVNRILHTFSRRDLFRTAGLAAGGAILLGLPKFLGSLAAEANAADTRSFTANSLFLELEGQPAGIVRAVEGGAAAADVLQDLTTPDGIARKRPGPVRFEDIVIDVPLGDDSKPLSAWITEMLSKTPGLRNGAIVYTDLNHNEVKRLEFFKAVLTEVSLPTADAKESKTSAVLTLRITPQSIRLAGGSGKPAKVSIGTKSKVTLSSNFRFNVQGLEKACGRISKVERITARRGNPTTATEQIRTQKGPGLLDCSNISIHLPEADAGPFYAWFDQTVVQGNTGGERAGLLEWLDPTMKVVVAKVQLGGLGIIRYAPEAIKAGSSEKVGLVQVGMYCETMNLTR